jgi:predicted nucleotidyltransferase
MNPVELPLDLASALTQHVKVCEQHGIRYALIGGLATGIRSRMRFTEDVDFLLDVPQLHLPRLLADLATFHFQWDQQAAITDWTQGHMLQLRYGDVPVDWLKPVLPCLAHILDRAETLSWRGTALRVAIAEDLIVLKLFALRTQDVADIQSLLAVNRGTLDLDLIRAELHATLPDDPVLQRFEELVLEFYVA